MRYNSLFPIACLLLLAVLSTAWQLDGFLANGRLLPRQDDSDSESTTSSEDASTGSTATADETASETDTDTATETASTTSSSDDDSEETDTASVTSTRTGSSSNSTHTTASNKTSTSVDARLPAGGISMITPSALATTYYKIGDNITFVWNYTSLSNTPSAVNVVASCSLNSATYTISGNMSVEQTQTVIWDTEKYQANATAPLLTATYTLIIWDESKDIDDTASAGELGSSKSNFGMYESQEYTDLDEFVCATCSGALSSAEVNALKFAMGMAFVTIASFTWFSSSFGLFST
ncbi:hypothetical protein BJX99DRAFT_160621 [Aspergillus californicus]